MCGCVCGRQCKFPCWLHSLCRTVSGLSWLTAQVRPPECPGVLLFPRCPVGMDPYLLSSDTCSLGNFTPVLCPVLKVPPAHKMLILHLKTQGNPLKISEAPPLVTCTANSTNSCPSHPVPAFPSRTPFWVLPPPVVWRWQSEQLGVLLASSSPLLDLRHIPHVETKAKCARCQLCVCPGESSVCTSWVLTVSSQGHLSIAVECFHTSCPPTGDTALFLTDSYTKGTHLFLELGVCFPSVFCDDLLYFFL